MKNGPNLFGPFFYFRLSFTAFSQEYLLAESRFETRFDFEQMLGQTKGELFK